MFNSLSQRERPPNFNTHTQEKLLLFLCVSVVIRASHIYTCIENIYIFFKRLPPSSFPSFPYFSLLRRRRREKKNLSWLSPAYLRNKLCISMMMVRNKKKTSFSIFLPSQGFFLKEEGRDPSINFTVPSLGPVFFYSKNDQWLLRLGFSSLRINHLTFFFVQTTSIQWAIIMMIA